MLISAGGRNDSVDFDISTSSGRRVVQIDVLTAPVHDDRLASGERRSIVVVYLANTAGYHGTSKRKTHSTLVAPHSQLL